MKTKTSTFRLREHREFSTPELAYKYWYERIAEEPFFDPKKEHVITFLLNHRMKLVGFNLTHIGKTTECFADSKLILRSALMEAVSDIVIAHNHPSGDCSPSQADIGATRNVNKSCEIMGISLRDHIIIGKPCPIYPSGYYSFTESGLL